VPRLLRIEEAFGAARHMAKSGHRGPSHINKKDAAIAGRV